jgi:AraC-like DNA-binding protein
MPLFMDLHKASDYDVKPTMDEIKHNHIADLNVQDKYGVKFLQYWINEEAGLVFCLMEAPDKEACAAVHQEAHGNMPCNIIELQGGDYMAIAGNETRVNEFDIVEKTDGNLDAGYRLIMVVDLISLTENELLPEAVSAIVKNSGGHFLSKPVNRKIIVFMPGSHAIESAMDIIQQARQLPGKTNEVRIGLSAGDPITDHQDIFADAIQLANRLCDIAQNGQVVISSHAKILAGENKLQINQKAESIKILNPENEQFLNQLTEAVNFLLFKTSFNIDDLGKHLGMSRSQLYRKIKELTGSSANSYIQELRMQKALQLIRNKYGNVTQVALESGFSNLSYFAKSFQKRFGVLPLKAAKLNS